jgi:RNase P subunit RPR2
MARSYFCPHCRKLLNPGTKVIFLVDTGQDCELMLLSAKLEPRSYSWWTPGRIAS